MTLCISPLFDGSNPSTVSSWTRLQSLVLTDNFHVQVAKRGAHQEGQYPLAGRDLVLWALWQEDEAVSRSDKGIAQKRISGN